MYQGRVGGVTGLGLSPKFYQFFQCFPYPLQAISKWVDAAEADFDSMFQVMFSLLQVMLDVLGITEAIHKDAEALSDSDSDTLTPLDDLTLDDLLLDDLDGSDTDSGDPL